jgi:hypothetical protein
VVSVTFYSIIIAPAITSRLAVVTFDAAFEAYGALKHFELLFAR